MSYYSRCEIDNLNIKLKSLKELIIDFYKEFELDEETIKNLENRYNFREVMNLGNFDKYTNSIHGNKEVTTLINKTVRNLGIVKEKIRELQLNKYNEFVKQNREELLVSSKNKINVLLNEYDDYIFRDFILQEYKKNKEEYGKVFNKEKILNKAKEKHMKYIKANLLKEEKIIESRKDDNKVEKEVIISYKNKVRKKTIDAIMNIISKQGFYFKRENIILKNDSYIVKANKITGEEVLLNIDLEGKFAFKFHNYKGKACLNDMTEFENKFEQIYGAKLKDKKVLWTENIPKLQSKDTFNKIQTRNLGGDK